MSDTTSTATTGLVLIDHQPFQFAKIFGGFAESRLATWRRTFAPHATGMGFDCGHFLN
jgi:hypothetical protein